MNKSYLYFLSCILFILAATIDCSAQSSSQTKAEKINELVSKYAEYGKFSGSALVAEKGDIIYKNGFGKANVEWDIPNEPNTKFRLASVTKQFTAMLVMQLAAEEKITLDTPISTYLPTYPNESGDQINIHHLLSHTSGIPNYTSFGGYWKMMKNNMTPSEIIEVFADSTLQFTPGERFSYSNSGYAILGAIIEEVTGKSFAAVLQEKILTPLDMKNTGYDSHKAILKNRAAGYNNNAGSFENTRYIDMSVAFTAGGMYSTVEDLYLWDQALYTTKLLPKQYLDLVFGKHIPAWGGHYGYGWNIGEMSLGNTKEKIKTIDHDGVVNGFSSLVLRFPEDHSSIILLHNTGGAPLYEMAKAIGGILYDKTYDMPKNSVAHSLLKAINKQGLDKGIAHYESIKNDPAYHLDEHELNMVSYELLKADKGKSAIAVLELAIASFPNAFNLYDSHGEILRKLGNEAAAIKSYKKSVSLNPKNDNGLKMLKELGVDIDKESLYLLKTDKSWTKEIFTFPLHFAKGLDYEGTEEAHFPKGWRNTESPEFWSYAFAWNINLTTKLSEAEMEDRIQIYFDGIMDVVNKEKDRILPKSIANLDQKDNGEDVSKFAGAIDVHDSFVTRESMRLYVQAESHYCEQQKKSIILFRFSPKEFNHEIWKELDNITLRADACKE